jgi:cyclopropane fatty-acyl-phospholipid synthase-like methyltransferase
LLDTSEEAHDYPVGEILLAFCDVCGFIQNTRFDQAKVDYSVPTEESQAFSPKFTEFATGLADYLTDRYELRGKSVLEIGCGKGDFLALLAERGLAHGLGIDPGYLPNRVVDSGADLEFRREWYGSEDTGLTADLVVTRHLMEHVPNVAEFFGWLADSVQATKGAALFTEVPDTGRVLDEGAFWDVYYEHCSYFTPGSLARTMRNAGLEVTSLAMGFDDQYILAESTLSHLIDPLPIEDTADQIASRVEAYAQRAATGIAMWRERVGDVLADGGSVAVWGGGSKAVAFISSIGIPDLTVVDINPHKQGKWLPGIGVEVRDPRVLAEQGPDLVIPMNPIYEEEITADLREMGLTPTVLSL